jgi:hypothetical protein
MMMDVQLSISCLRAQNTPASTGAGDDEGESADLNALASSDGQAVLGVVWTRSGAEPRGDGSHRCTAARTGGASKYEAVMLLTPAQIDDCGKHDYRLHAAGKLIAGKNGRAGEHDVSSRRRHAGARCLTDGDHTPARSDITRTLAALTVSHRFFAGGCLCRGQRPDMAPRTTAAGTARAARRSFTYEVDQALLLSNQRVDVRGLPVEMIGDGALLVKRWPLKPDVANLSGVEVRLRATSDVPEQIVTHVEEHIPEEPRINLVAIRGDPKKRLIPRCSDVKKGDLTNACVHREQQGPRLPKRHVPRCEAP